MIEIIILKLWTNRFCCSHVHGNCVKEEVSPHLLSVLLQLGKVLKYMKKNF